MLDWTSYVNFGSVAEWSIAPDCKSGAVRLREFESLPAHNDNFELSLELNC